MAAQTKSEGQVSNLGHSEHISLNKLAALLVYLNEHGHYKLISFSPDREVIDIGDYYGDFKKIQTALGWRPQASLRDGLARTLEYYRRNRAHYWEPTP